jgi:ferredoxin
MAIPTSRTKEPAQITIDYEKCNGCGLCVDVCKDFSIVMKDGKAHVSGTPFFGCIGCGHCMAICPKEAITVNGRFISASDLFPLPEKESAAKYESILSLYQRRRSVREFKDKPVEQELINKVLEAAKTAPMGIPPSDVSVVVLGSKEKVRQFAEDYCTLLEGMKWFVSKGFLAIMRPFWGKAGDEMFRGFLRPLVHGYIRSMKAGDNFVTYDAPVALYFYGSPYCDPADPVIAATYAMIAAESLGLGTCMLGGVHPFIQKGKAARRFREKYGIRYTSREGLIVIMGYPRLKYHKGIRRTFANVITMN